MLTNGLQILPNNERQLRPLVSLEAEVQIEAWQKAVEQAGGKVPSGRIVKDVVQRIMERTQVPKSLSDRINRVYSSSLEESVQKFLEMLGKLNRVYLTGLEEKLLSVLESEIRD